MRSLVLSSALFSLALTAAAACPALAQGNFNQSGNGWGQNSSSSGFAPQNFSGQPAWQGQYPGHFSGNWGSPMSGALMNAAEMNGTPMNGMPMGGLLQQSGGFGSNNSNMPGGFGSGLGSGNGPGANLLRMFLGGQPQMQQAPVMQAPADQNLFSRQNMLRAFMGGSPSGGRPSRGGDNDAAASGNAQSQLQVARDQASQAESAASRASYGQKGMRSSAADEAQNHANAARAAASRATSAAGQSRSGQDYAAQARNAADRAQGAADRARYNASTGN